MAQLEPLNIRISGNSAGLSTAISDAQGKLSSFASTVSGKLTAALATLAPIGAGGGLGFATKLAADAQDAELTFKSLTGSMSESRKVLADLKKFGASTPFEFTKDVKPAAQQLLNYGFSVSELEGQLKIIGNVAAVSGSSFSELAMLVGRARSNNLLFTDDLNQLSDRAIPILDLLSQRFGVTADEVRKLASEGKVNFSDLQAVLETLGGEGGKFGKAMEERSAVLNGVISTLKDNVVGLAENIGKALIPAASSFVNSINSMVLKLSSLNTSTVETIAKITAMAAGFGAAAIVVPRLVQAFTALVASIRAVGTASAIAQALSGPKGWATLAIGVAAAAAAVYSVDGLFESLAEKQRAVAAAGDEVSESFREIEKRAIDSGDSIAKLQKDQDSWLKQAETIRQQLASPEERYTKSIEDLGLAVTQGGLEFDFFARGVRKAYEELQKAKEASKNLELPDAVLKGSQELIDLQLNASINDDGVDLKAREAEVAAQLKAVGEQLKAESQATVDAMAKAAVDSAELNVAKLTKSLEGARQQLEESKKQLDEAIAARDATIAGNNTFFASVQKNLLGNELPQPV